jgi:hypothetical protein
LLHLEEGLAGAEPGGGGAENGGCRIEVIARNKLGALDGLNIEECPQWNHLAILVTDIEVLYVPGSQTVMVVGLDVDLEDLVELVE